MNIENTLISYSVDDLLIKYRMLNKFYKEIIARHYLKFDQQRQITDFYIAFHNYECFERAILFFIRTTEKENKQIIVSHLKNAINKNIELYLDNNKFLDEIDTNKVCDSGSNSIHFKIKAQEKYTNEKSKELRDIINSLESPNSWDDKELTKFLHKEEERIKALYEIEKNNLALLYKEERESKVYASNYSQNIFNKIYDLNFTFMKLLSDYFQDNAEKSSDILNNRLKEEKYFDMELVSKVHKVCNGIQFENLTEIELYLILNLQPTNARLKIKKNEIVRMCYLIYNLSYCFKENEKVEWIGTILNTFGINKGTYDSKCTEPNSKSTSNDNEDFKKLLKPIFSNIS